MLLVAKVTIKILKTNKKKNIYSEYMIKINFCWFKNKKV